ncbi:DUF1232 domain-containing protein [Nocardioides sp. KIGAM211]|uniref:DUF1232 domain-containing protein n=1 Tax=Nocardioides luti TaxID=2761101 RepID=A0A7X0RKD6_9ACTN|nr:YkvA family protein [Nocardioides luti]MBB6629762.1 DUF1232 domain-containing protein [Nocardioides luti]
MWWQSVIGVVAGLALVWTGLVGCLYYLGRKQDNPTRFSDVLRLLPDVLVLVRRLASDRTLPRGVRVRLAILMGYLVFPIDLVPDFIPVIGYADDAIVLALALRSVARIAGNEALERHWPGTPAGLLTVKRLANIPNSISR